MEPDYEDRTITTVLGESDHPERSWQIYMTAAGHDGYVLMLIPEFFDKENWIKDRGGITITQDFVSRFGKEMENGDKIFTDIFNWSNINCDFPFIVCDTAETADIRMLAFSMETRLEELSEKEFEDAVDRLVRLLYSFQENGFDTFRGY